MTDAECFTWENEYSVGVMEIDSQHKDLMKLLNDLIRHSTEPKVKRVQFFQKAIEMAHNYFANHFDTEERVLNKTDYEKFMDHKKEHENIIARVKAIWSELGTNNEDAVMHNLTITLKEYFLSHILLFDKEAQHFLRSGNEVFANAGFQEGIV